jgi:ribosomal protein L37E
MQIPAMRCRDCGRPLKPFQQEHCPDCSFTRRLENTRDVALRKHLNSVHDRKPFPDALS